MSGRLSKAVQGLLCAALERYRDNPCAVEVLRHHLGRLARPPRIAIAGGWRSGKSTLANAILGEEFGPVELADGRPVFTWYEDAPSPCIATYAPTGARQELAVTRTARGVRVELPDSAEEVVDVVVGGRSRLLRHMTVIDTPPLQPGASEEGRSSGAERILRAADAVLYLTPEVRGSDLWFLRQAQEGMVAAAAPINLLLVLSRADEVGGGRPDALLAARQVARHQRRNPRVSPLCVNVIAVSGLVALAGRLLTDADFSALAALAAAPRADIEPYLLSADRFVSAASLRVAAEVRRRLLERLGFCGVRLAMTLIRVAGCDSRAKLSAELVRRSGLPELREAVGRCFVDRAEVVRARSALLSVERILRAEPRPGSGELFARLERIVAGAHEFRELRLLAALHSAEVSFDAELAGEAQRLLGGGGTGVHARLGVELDSGVDELWARGLDALARWRGLAEDPLFDRAQRRAARVVARSCEGILAELAGHR